MNNTSSGSGTQNTGGRFSLLGSLGQLTVSDMSSADYVATTGLVSFLPLAQLNLDYAHVFPNPFKSALGHTKVTFTKLTMETTIRIYTVSGELVTTLRKYDTLDYLDWNLVNDAGRAVASGLYIYIIQSGDMTKTGKLVLIR